MLHKHPSAEKAQVYFGITEKLKHDAANFFIYIQPKLGQIYDNSVYKALGESFNFQDVRDKHLTHLSTLLTGGIDHRFIEESHSLQKKYVDLGVTTGEYVKLYQLIISYLSGEAHKKHWWRYKKYRDLNRSIRNLLLFDLAIATSPKELESSLDTFKPSKKLLQTELLVEDSLENKTTLDELNLLLENSHVIINECHKVIQSVLELTHQSKAFLSEDSSNDTINTQPSLFANDFEETLELIKTPSNQNRPAFEEILSLTQEKIQKVSQFFLTETKEISYQQINVLEDLLEDIHENISILSTIQGLPTSKNKSKVDPAHLSLHSQLKKSSAAISSHLISLDAFKERKALIR